MTYISQGTISVKFNLDNDQPTSLYFIPERDYSIKHRGKKSAVFVQSETSATIRPLDNDGCVQIRLDLDEADLGKPIKDSKLTVGELLAYVLAPSAGITNAKVEVWVEVQANPLKLVAIRPAK